MNRRTFIINSTVLTGAGVLQMKSPGLLAAGIPGQEHRLPATDGHYLRTCGYVEDIPVPDYT